jgi:hypothetical protein
VIFEYIFQYLWVINGVFALCMAGLAWHYRLKLKAWRLVFSGLSNAERILLMWPSVNGKPVRQLTFMVDRSDDGYARLHNGPMLMAKFPLKAAIKGQRDLKELVEST